MDLRPFLDTMTLKNADFSGSFSLGDFATTFMQNFTEGGVSLVIPSDSKRLENFSKKKKQKYIEKK